MIIKRDISLSEVDWSRCGGDLLDIMLTTNVPRSESAKRRMQVEPLPYPLHSSSVQQRQLGVHPMAGLNSEASVNSSMDYQYAQGDAVPSSSDSHPLLKSSSLPANRSSFHIETHNTGNSYYQQQQHALQSLHQLTTSPVEHMSGLSHHQRATLQQQRQKMIYQQGQQPPLSLPNQSQLYPILTPVGYYPSTSSKYSSSGPFKSNKVASANRNSSGNAAVYKTNPQSNNRRQSNSNRKSQPTQGVIPVYPTMGGHFGPFASNAGYDSMVHQPQQQQQPNMNAPTLPSPCFAADPNWNYNVHNSTASASSAASTSSDPSQTMPSMSAGSLRSHGQTSYEHPIQSTWSGVDDINRYQYDEMRMEPNMKTKEAEASGLPVTPEGLSFQTLFIDFEYYRSRFAVSQQHAD